MRIILLFTGILFLSTGCSNNTREGSFVTYLGVDTLAAEQYTYSGNRLVANVMLRTPRTAYHRYVLRFDNEGMLNKMETRIYDPSVSMSRPERRSVLIARREGFKRTRYEEGEEEEEFVETTAEALPFLDMIHWPYDVVLDRVFTLDETTYEQPLIVESRALPFEVRRIADDSVTIKHPYRGTMGARISLDGLIQVLDASRTTRKLRVVRTEALDVKELAEDFAEREANGTPFGPLSGRAETIATTQGGTLRINYGTPSKRGRTIFGNVVPWGEVWRTGANRATHFETSRAIQLGDLLVPEGTYTLFTIPEPGGGTLIVNKQTDQGGTSYDATMDLGRVPMNRLYLDRPVEAFTISVEGSPPEQSLHLRWDQSAFTVPIHIPE